MGGDRLALDPHHDHRGEQHGEQRQSGDHRDSGAG
jgi:hypothetical protein